MSDGVFFFFLLQLFVHTMFVCDFLSLFPLSCLYIILSYVFCRLCEAHFTQSPEVFLSDVNHEIDAWLGVHLRTKVHCHERALHFKSNLLLFYGPHSGHIFSLSALKFSL